MAAPRRHSPAPATPRRAVPIKHADGEPLTRSDIQFDFLDAIFSNSNAVFTDPYTLGTDKLTFKDLYVSAILNSPKATKVLKDKMNDLQMFAVDFSMLALLVNVGRVNTTMSFFPGMKTSIRTYHPIPALSRTDGNLQDAPRIKHVLKASVLGSDAKNIPATPTDLLNRCKTGKRPSTSVTNLIFVLAHHAAPVGQAHFEGQLTFLDLFLRTDISSDVRAQIFLWLCYNYLESSGTPEDNNPFSPAERPRLPPPFTVMTAEEIALENQETPDDIAKTDSVLALRNRIVVTQGVKDALGKESTKASASGSIAGDDDDEATASLVGEEPKAKGKKAATTSASAKGKGKRAAKEKKVILTIDKSKARDMGPRILDLDDDEQMIDSFVKQRSSSGKNLSAEPFQHPSALFSTLPNLRHRVSSDQVSHRYSPYASSASSLNHTRSRNRRPPHFPPRTMSQQAWHLIRSTDPLVDSDNESGGDEYMRDDYLQRLDVIRRFSQQRWSQEQPSYSTQVEMDGL